MFNKFFYSVVLLFCISCSNSIEDNMPIQPINITEITKENLTYEEYIAKK